MLQSPTASLLPIFYAKSTAVTFAAIGTGALIARLFDGLSDPIIGLLSDRTRTRFGRRKPWILAGALLASPAVWFFFNPSAESDVLYFTFWYIVVTIAWTMVEIPHYAWASELVDSYDQRSSIAFYRTAFAIVGSILFATVPLLPLFPSSEFDGDVFRFLSWTIIIGIALTTTITLLLTPEPARNVETRRFSLSKLAGILRINRPFQSIVLTLVIYGIASGMYSATFFVFVDTELKLGDRIAHVWTISTFAGFCTLSLWPPVLQRFNKHRILSVSILSMATLLSSSVFIPFDETGFVPLIVLVSTSFGAGYGIAIVIPAMLMDVAEYDVLKTGIAKPGIYFAIYVLLNKTMLGLGFAIAFNLLSLFGYEAGQDNTEMARWGMRLTAFIIPFILAIGAASWVWFYPLNRQRVSIIQRRLQARTAASAKARSCRRANST